MNDIQTQIAADNCEVLRARLAKYEDAEGRPVVVGIGPLKDLIAELRDELSDGGVMDTPYWAELFHRSAGALESQARDIEKAKQQITGFICGQRHDVRELVNSMGLTLDEWLQIKTDCAWIPAAVVAEFDELLPAPPPAPASAAYCTVRCIDDVKAGQLQYEAGRVYDLKGHSIAGVEVYADSVGSFSVFNNPAFNKYFNVETYRAEPASADVVPVPRELLKTVLDPVCTDDWAPACKQLRALLNGGRDE